MATQVQIQSFRNNNVYEDVFGIIQDDKEFGHNTLPWCEEFTDNEQIEGVSYQARITYDIMVKGKRISQHAFTKVVCKGGVRDKALKLKLKPGSRIRFTGMYHARKGNTRWFTSFEVLHPDFLETVKKADSAI